MPAVGTLPPVETTTTVILPPIPVIALGDSVMLGAAPKLLEALGRGHLRRRGRRPAVQGGRSRSSRRSRAQGRFGHSVVLHLGNNGPMSAATFRSVMDALVNVPLVLVVNVRVTKPWEPAVNQVLAEQVPTYPNARLHGLVGRERDARRLVLRRQDPPQPGRGDRPTPSSSPPPSAVPAPAPTTRRPRRRRRPRAAPVETTAAPVVVETTAAPLPPP